MAPVCTKMVRLYMHLPGRQQSRNFGGGSFGQQFSLRVIRWDGRALRSPSIFAALISLSADTRATYGARGGRIYGVNEIEVTAPIRFSTGIGDHRQRQAELEKAEQIDGGAHHMRATMQVPQTVEPLPCEAKQVSSQTRSKLRSW